MNERRLIALRDLYRGRSCILIGNGPSLRIEDLERLSDEITFGCNRLHVVFGETAFRPTYYSVIDTTAASAEAAVLDSMPVTKLLPYEFRSYLRRHENCVYFDTGGGNLRGFSPNPLRQELYGGYSVLFIQMQIAFFMGFETVYLIGCDHSWQLPAESHVQGNEVMLVSDRELNHFHPDYHRPGDVWAKPKPDLQNQAFELAERFYRKAGRSILNATRGGKLETFPRVDFDRVF
ncbi:MAG: 6-hydroxymethylpterin diphosphokinase MptE-like protein [Myxococcota bacterium]